MHDIGWKLCKAEGKVIDLFEPAFDMDEMYGKSITNKDIWFLCSQSKATFDFLFDMDQM